MNEWKHARPGGLSVKADLRSLQVKPRSGGLNYKTAWMLRSLLEE